MNTDTKPNIEASKGWKAALHLGYEPRQNITKLVCRTQRGPLAVQRSLYPEGATCHTYLLHPPGGVVGGDQLDIRVQTSEGAHAVITTPGATKFYRSEGKLAYQRQTLTVESGSTLEWLPQENICFPGAHAQITSDIYLALGSRYLGWEIQCLGRPANGETFEMGMINSASRVWMGKKLVLVDQLRNQGSELIRSASGLRGHAMNATLIAGTLGEAHLEGVRARLGEIDTDCQFGVTWMDDLLIVRILGNNTEAIQHLLKPVRDYLREHWLNLPAHAPRIWAT